ncbi:MAG TPA: penicillin-binding transpeptidase domain-containing protein [Acidobacteriaceae bacterium]|jgi:cell division protein FtsI/penicillin-binding protein 2|nr:penicillin-binding transpeptidase domain-containing protein [Acidobacteriaceae bacterium]
MKRLVFSLLLVFLVAPTLVFAASTTTTRRTHHRRLHESAATRRRLATLHHSERVTGAHVVRASLNRTYYRHTRRHRYYERFTASSFATSDITAGDITAGEDPVVRQAAINALGDMNGTVVAIDPSNGRILAMVNQKLALSSGAEPCSTIKLSVALAALEEDIVTKDTPVNLGGHFYLNMTEALAHSNNLYFETLGRRLGFERVRHYATEFGLGELAGYDIPGEHPGIYPDQAIPESEGGVGRMCSFGEGVSMTPLQLGALVAAIANGGTLYYLQHPTTPAEALNFQPRIKRTLNIAPILPEIEVGMQAAVRYGTARSLRTNFNEFPVLGKTGTCSNDGTRFGWFASYADTQYGRIVAVFFLEGGRPTFGPKAAELTGVFYRDLLDSSYFAEKQPAEAAPAATTAIGAPQ